MAEKPLTGRRELIAVVPEGPSHHKNGGVVCYYKRQVLENGKHYTLLETDFRIEEDIMNLLEDSPNFTPELIASTRTAFRMCRKSAEYPVQELIKIVQMLDREE